MYTLMARYGRAAICSDAQGASALLAAARCAVSALQGVHLLRDAASSAAIMIWAAVALPALSDEAAALMLAQGLCCTKGASPVHAAPSEQHSSSIVEAAWARQVGSLDQRLLACA